jgi:hypothetical protein
MRDCCLQKKIVCPVCVDGDEACCMDEEGRSKGRMRPGCRLPLYTYVPHARLILHAKIEQPRYDTIS